ncbi:hypothetical protein BRC83_02970 [Halobacteriales archaeon QS_1_68_17]|jgi:hypothetical protein|nr:MAG: hypothetical protein BRC83_02970 [Halobacteriales archaeon QS_1_68_17]
MATKQPEIETEIERPVRISLARSNPLLYLGLLGMALTVAFVLTQGDPSAAAPVAPTAPYS